MCAEGLPADVRLAAKTHDGRLPFVFEASGVETHFTNGFDPDPRARLIFNAPRPETLARILREAAPDPQPSLPEADASDMDYFTSQLEIVLPVLGVNAIRVPLASPVDDRDDAQSPVFYLRNARQGVDARAQQIAGEFTVLAGSAVVASWRGEGKAASTVKAYASYRAQHEQLVADGAIVVENGRGRVTRNIPFTSPSTAGAVAWGHSCNGRREWISTDGVMFGQWESRGVE